MRHLGARGAEPAPLVASKVDATAALEGQVAAGTQRLSFRGHVYGSEAVRAELNNLHHGKCAFCEVRIAPVSPPHVEHFRPKAAVINEITGAKIKPGYYWLAYRWSNLFLACPACNSASYKGNRFPLVNEGARATVDADLHLEQPLLVDPVEKDPREYIRFRGPVAYPVNDNAIGKTTIDVLGLNREELVEARAAHLELFSRIANAVAEMEPGPARADLEQLLVQLQKPPAPFLSCLCDTIGAACP